MLQNCLLSSPVSLSSVSPLLFSCLNCGGKPPPPPWQMEATRPPPEPPDKDPPPPPNPEAPPPPPEPPNPLNYLSDFSTGLHVRGSFCNGHHTPASPTTTIHNQHFLWSFRSFYLVPAIRSAADLFFADLFLLTFGISNTSAVKFLPPLFVKSGGVPVRNPVRTFFFERHDTRSGGCMQSMAIDESKLISGSDQVEKKISGAFRSFGFVNSFETLMGLAQFIFVLTGSVRKVWAWELLIGPLAFSE